MYQIGANHRTRLEGQVGRNAVSEVDVSDELAFGRSRPKWRIRFLFGSLILIPVCLAIPFVYFVYSCDQELREAFAEADRLDPGWRILDLERKRAVIPDEGNSGLNLIAVKSLLPANWPFWNHLQAPENRNRSQDELRKLQESLSELEPPAQLDERQTAALREELRRADLALATARKVAELPRGRYAITYTKDILSTFVAHAQNTREMTNLLAYDPLLRVQDGDLDGALTSCRGMLNCGRSIGDEPMVISMLIRVAIDSVTAKKVEWILAQGEASTAALSAMQKELDDEAAQPLLLIGVRGDRAGVDTTMQLIQEGDYDVVYASAFRATPGEAHSIVPVMLLRIPGVTKSIRAAMLKHNNRFVEIAKLPVEQQVGHIEEIKATIRELPEVFRYLGGTSLQLAEMFHLAQAELRCAVVMLAVERYRRALNRWPDALTDLVPTYLPRVPLDPYDGAPLRYRRLNDGVVIYSVGRDGKDDGGKFDKNPVKAGTDRGFRLWDVRQRRQLPKPPKHSDAEPGHERD
jgi:hypothetical protein